MVNADICSITCKRKIVQTLKNVSILLSTTYLGKWLYSQLLRIANFKIPCLAKESICNFFFFFNLLHVWELLHKYGCILRYFSHKDDPTWSWHYVLLPISSSIRQYLKESSSVNTKCQQHHWSKCYQCSMNTN